MSAWHEHDWLDGGLEAVLAFLDAVSVEAPGMTRQELHILLAIANAGDDGLSPDDLVDLAGWPWMNVDCALSVMEQQEYIARIPSDHSAGVKAAAITGDGEALLDRIADRWRGA